MVKTSENVVNFSATKQLMEQSDPANFGCFYSPLFKSKEQGDADFVELIRVGYNGGGKQIKVGKEIEILPYAVIDWSHLLPELASFTRLQDAIAEEVGRHQIFFVKEFKLGSAKFKKGDEFDKNAASKLILQFNRMFDTSGKMGINSFITEMPVLNKYDESMQMYEMIKANGKVVPNIVEDFVANYIGWNPKNKKEVDMFKLDVSNIVRMIKHAYYLINQSQNIKNPKKFKIISQYYLLQGTIGVGKTEFIRQLFLGNLSSSTKYFNAPQYVQLRSMNPAFLVDEMGPFNKKENVGQHKAEVSTNYYDADRKYVVNAVTFLARSIIIGATNERNMLTDTTANGDDRRTMFVRFRFDGNKRTNGARIINFFKSHNLPLTSGANEKVDYDTTKFYTDMQYSVLFGDQYSDIPIEMKYGTDEIMDINDSLLSTSRNTTTTQELVKEFMDSSIPVIGKYETMLASQHTNSISKIDEVTSMVAQDIDKDKIINTINGGDDYYGATATFDDVIEVKSLDRVLKKDIIQYLKQNEVHARYSSELADAMQLMGYIETSYRNRVYFVRE